MIKEFARHHMKTSEIKIEEDLAKIIWSRGVRSPPRKIRVRMNKTDEGHILVSPFIEETKETPSKKSKKDKPSKEEKQSEVKESTTEESTVDSSVNEESLSKVISEQDTPVKKVKETPSKETKKPSKETKKPSKETKKPSKETKKKSK
jgi:large subunit ribosomal protein L31e